MLAMAIGPVAGTPPAAAQELAPGGTFVDDDGNVHEPAIEALVAAGITEGCGENRYCPADPVTRGEMASFITRGVAGLEGATRDWFPDDESSIHESNIDVVAENEIALGYPDGTYRPDASVTRGEMASFLSRAITDLAAATRDWFPDDAGNSHEPAINVIAENEITIGYPDGTYRPQAEITRGEMATMLVRALDLTPIDPRVDTNVYFFLASTSDDPQGAGPFLVPVARSGIDPAAPATPTMNALLAGPTPGEQSGTPAISTAIPSGVEVLGLVIEGGVATVDLSAGFASGGGSFSMLGRVAQVVFTLTQFPTVDRVEFEIEGEAVDTLGGEGVVLSAYDTREELFDTDLLPLVFVDSPSFGGEADDPMRIVGWTRSFEAQFVLAIVDGNGRILVEEPVLAQGPQLTTPGGVPWTRFDVTVDYDVASSQTGALIAWDTSAEDGSQIGVREYPVSLSP